MSQTASIFIIDDFYDVFIFMRKALGKLYIVGYVYLL